jgi:hypothetical protein
VTPTPPTTRSSGIPIRWGEAGVAPADRGWVGSLPQNVTVMLFVDPVDYRNNILCSDWPGSGIGRRIPVIVRYTGIDAAAVPPIGADDRLSFAGSHGPDTSIHSLSMPVNRKASLTSAEACAIAHGCADANAGALRLPARDLRRWRTREPGSPAARLGLDQRSAAHAPETR